MKNVASFSTKVKREPINWLFYIRSLVSFGVEIILAFMHGNNVDHCETKILSISTAYWVKSQTENNFTQNSVLNLAVTSDRRPL